MMDPLPGKSRTSRPRGLALRRHACLKVFRQAGVQWLLFTPWLLYIVCLCVVLCTTNWPLFHGSSSANPITPASESAIKTGRAKLKAPTPLLGSSPLPPVTLGLEAPIGTQDGGNEFLILGPSDRLLDREVSERVRNYWPLRELLLAFNRDFRTTESPLNLELSTCQGSGLSSHLESSPPNSPQTLHRCYDLLQQMDDYADDLSGSLTEQHLAVLDMLYLTVIRELSRLLLAEATAPSTHQALQLRSSSFTAVKALAALSPDIALDQLTAQLPQILQLQQQSIIVSGTQWLFNQGHPRLSPEQLSRWTGQAISLENYRALICTAERLQPKNFPFLESAIPNDFALDSCP